MDIQYLLFLQKLREATGGIFNSFFMFITDLGWSVIPFFALIGMYWCIDKNIGQYMLMNSYIAGWINGIVKITACVYRPWIRSSEIKPVSEAKVTATGYSFPSGHTSNAFSVWGGILVSYRKKPAIRNTMIVLLVLIGFSRNYLGVHTPQDVLVSSLIGIVVLFVTFKIMPIFEKDTSKDKWVLLLSIVMGVIMILYASLKSYPMDYVDGVLLVDPKKLALDSWGQGGEILAFGISWYVERRWINFSVEGSVSERLGRFLIGGLIVIFLFHTATPLCNLILNESIARFVSKMIIVFFIMIIYPYFIKKTSKNK